MQEIPWETCHSQGTAVLLIFESTVSFVEYLSNFYANLEYNLSPMSIRIETVDTLGINRESLSAAINSNTGDSRCTHFSPAVIPKCVNSSTKLQSQKVIDLNQACIVREANKTLCASISSKIDELPDFYSNCDRFNNAIFKNVFSNHSYVKNDLICDTSNSKHTSSSDSRSLRSTFSGLQSNFTCTVNNSVLLNCTTSISNHSYCAKSSNNSENIINMLPMTFTTTEQDQLQ